jgi:hypothetical protein
MSFISDLRSQSSVTEAWINASRHQYSQESGERSGAWDLLSTKISSIFPTPPSTLLTTQTIRIPSISPDVTFTITSDCDTLLSRDGACNHIQL